MRLTEGKLNQKTWDSFIDRLHYDYKRVDVNNHHTEDVVFVVQARQITYGIDRCFSNKLVILHRGCEWFSPQEYWDAINKDDRNELDKIALNQTGGNFLDCSMYDQFNILEGFDDHVVTGWRDEWVYVNSHLTCEDAWSFIRSKAHGYDKGLRVYVAHTNCLEYNTIKEAILTGQIGFIDRTSNRLSKTRHDKGE